MENNNNFIEIQSNTKRICVRVNLANLSVDHCLRKQFWLIKTKFEEPGKINYKLQLYVLNNN
jgi:hypothetical protein